MLHLRRVTASRERHYEFHRFTPGTTFPHDIDNMPFLVSLEWQDLALCSYGMIIFAKITPFGRWRQIFISATFMVLIMSTNADTDLPGMLGVTRSTRLAQVGLDSKMQTQEK